MVRFVLRFQAVDDLYRFLDGRFSDIDFLEATRQARSFSKMLLNSWYVVEPITRILPLESSGLIRLAASTATRSSTGTDDGMDLIDKQDAVGILLQLF